MAMKRILRDFRIDEISAVDRPAQEGALATILKQRERPSDHQAVELAAPRSFDEAVDKMVKAEGLARHVAMSKARAAHPRLYERYQLEGEREAIAKHAQANGALKAADAVRSNTARMRFNDMVEDLALRKRIPGTRAMSLVREREPQLFAEAYGRR